MKKISITVILMMLVSLQVFAKTTLDLSTALTNMKSESSGHTACNVRLGYEFSYGESSPKNSSVKFICDGKESSLVYLKTQLKSFSDVNLQMSLAAKELIEAGLHPGSCVFDVTTAHQYGDDGIAAEFCWFYGK